MKPKVKICGITNIKDALQSVWCGTDALGFVFYKGSRRYINPKKAKQIIEILPPWIFKVGLFVNEKTANIKKIAKQCRLDFIQLHGNENAAYLKKLRDFRVIKAVRIKNRNALKDLDNLSCEMILFDAYSDREFGGTGKKFDWDFDREIKKIRKPYIISGGLTPFNVGRAIKRFLPYAVDVSSGVEISPSKKDKRLLKEFIENAKK